MGLFIGKKENIKLLIKKEIKNNSIVGLGSLDA